MTAALVRRTPKHGRLPIGRSRHGRTIAAVAVLGALVVLVTGATLARNSKGAQDESSRQYLAASGWPQDGEAAYQVNAGHIVAGPHQRVVPIASVAKMMTAYLVLRAAPLQPGKAGLALHVTRADVADWVRRAMNGESVVEVKVGEVLTERQALIALLLPSANNIAVMLARRVSGSVQAFVARMNATARALGMRHTTYTDPSGLDEHTVSTAVDQLVLADAAMHQPAFAGLVRTRTHKLPVVGRVSNTDTLLGSGGFVGIKTGSDDAAGGCFALRASRSVSGRMVTLTGVVLGQPGEDTLSAGLAASKQFADRILTGHRPAA